MPSRINAAAQAATRSTNAWAAQVPVTAMATNPLEASSYQEREYFTDEYERLALAARNWQIAVEQAENVAVSGRHKY